MDRLGFYFNQEMCSGCRSCQIACKDRADLDVGRLLRQVSTFQAGTYPNATLYHYSAACNHCAAAACVANCPTGAMHVDESDGTVQHDDGKCIGCSTCVRSCPYGVPILIEEENLARKCDSCKPYRDAGMNPVCVDACTMRCLDFGVLSELEAKYGTENVSNLPILPGADTDPSILIHPKQAALSDDFKVVLI